MRWLVLVSLVFWLTCDQNNPAGPVVAANEVNYGDTLLVRMSCQDVPDTNDVGVSRVLEITLLVQNISERQLKLDSTSRGTIINVYRDSPSSLVWAAPSMLAPADTLVKKIILNADDTCLLKARWPRLNEKKESLPKGRYVIRGWILGLASSDLIYDWK